jgi:3-isopropylmalate/(R)-2-methylmalate dehydratase small subunit
MTTPFTRVRSVAAPLPLTNVNTEVISPKDLMRAVTRKGLGWGLFRPYRFNEDGTEKPEFVLNRPPWRNAEILVSLENFGCGSSREHAVWALADFGIRCIVAVSFADIFLNSCLKNRLLPVTLERSEVDQVLEEAEAGAEIEVDLTTNSVTLADGRRFAFTLNELHRQRLLDGADDISETLRFGGEIDDFERAHRERQPWLSARVETDVE